MTIVMAIVMASGLAHLAQSNRPRQGQSRSLLRRHRAARGELFRGSLMPRSLWSG